MLAHTYLQLPYVGITTVTQEEVVPNMSIVVVTIPGPAKQKFVADLQAATGGAVSLVVIQKRPVRPLAERIQSWQTLPLLEQLSRLYYGLRLRLQPALRERLTVFQATEAPDTEESEWAAPTYYTYDVNSEEVFAKVAAIKPTILAVWGSSLLAHRLVALPTHALNLHFGISRSYRGAYANQRAVEKGDWEAIGTTIHYMNGRADSGAVIAEERLPKKSTPYAAFSAMHDKILATYVDCIAALATGVALPVTKPDLTKSENLKLSDWTPKRRFRVAAAIDRWHRRGHL